MRFNTIMQIMLGYQRGVPSFPGHLGGPLTNLKMNPNNFLILYFGALMLSETVKKQFPHDMSLCYIPRGG